MYTVYMYLHVYLFVYLFDYLFVYLCVYMYHRSMTTVQEHGEYQLSVIEEERCGTVPPTNRSMLKFGTNCDLSDKHK